MNRLCIIPARGGSKRIPRKNVRPFCGKPIIAYSIGAAIKSGLFDEVMVSTDDEEISEVARLYGAQVPFMRSAQNANDHAGLAEVLIEVVEGYAKFGKLPAHLCCILPTAPFITADILERACALVDSDRNDCAFTVVEYGYPIQRSLFLDEHYMRMRWPEHLASRSQDLEKAYHDAGQAYVITTSALLTQRKLFTERAGGVVLDELSVQDIDTETDWALAELKYKMTEKA